MISYFKGGGIKKTQSDYVIDINLLHHLIKNNPARDTILKIHQMECGSKEYDDAKRALDYVTPHGTFNGERKNENIKQLSNYLYFDIDQKDMKSDVEGLKNEILNKYRNMITMIGKSAGGRGLFFYVKVKKGLSVNNFDDVWNYFQQEVFFDLPIDIKAKSISRPQFIPYDEDVYFNDAVAVDIPGYFFSGFSKDINEESKELGFIAGSNQYIKPQPPGRYIPKQTSNRFIDFIGYKDLCSSLILETKVEVPPSRPFILKEVDFVKVPIFPIIRTGFRHNMFKIQINCLIYLNPDITLLEVQSFINFWNRHMTEEPLSTKDMLDTVRREYNALKAGSKNIARITKKFVHTNPLFADRVAIANRANGRRKVRRSKRIIEDTINKLIECDSDINLKNIEKQTEGLIKIGTIKKYWKRVIKQMLSDALTEQESEMHNNNPFDGAADFNDMLELGFVLDKDGKWRLNLTKKSTEQLLLV